MMVSSDREMRATIVERIADLRALRDEWEDLWSRCQSNRTPFLHFDWVRLWSEHYGLDGRLRVLVVRSACRAVGIVPLVLRAYRVGPCSMNVVETLAGQSRNLIGLVDPAFTKETAEAVAEFFKASIVEKGTAIYCSLVMIETGFPAALVTALSAAQSVGFLRIDEVSRAPYVPLPISWHDYWHAMSRRRRKVLRRASLALEARHAVAHKECDIDEIPDAMDSLYALHQHRWRQAGIRGLFADSRARSFHTAIAVAHASTRLIRVSALRIDDRVASVHIIGVLDGVAYLLRSGRDTQFSRLSIGHMHEVYMLRSAIGEGLREVDFLRGAEPYKFYWTQRYRTYSDLLIGARYRGRPMPVRLQWLFLRAARFLEHGHSPGELIAILKLKRREARERRKMGVDG